MLQYHIIPEKKKKKIIVYLCRVFMTFIRWLQLTRLPGITFSVYKQSLIIHKRKLILVNCILFVCSHGSYIRFRILCILSGLALCLNNIQVFLICGSRAFTFTIDNSVYRSVITYLCHPMATTHGRSIGPYGDDQTLKIELLSHSK